MQMHERSGSMGLNPAQVRRVMLKNYNVCSDTFIFAQRQLRALPQQRYEEDSVYELEISTRPSSNALLSQLSTPPKAPSPLASSTRLPSPFSSGSPVPQTNTWVISPEKQPLSLSSPVLSSRPPIQSQPKDATTPCVCAFSLSSGHKK